MHVRTGAGDISVERAVGRAEIKTGSGAVEIGGVDGPAVVKNSNGDTWIGEVTGELHANAANGKIAVDRPQAAVHAKTANGDILLGAVARGEIVAETGFGKVDIGVVDGVPAWLELHTSFGNVRNELDAADRPEPGEDAVEIRARTGYGDITIHRAVVDRARGSAVMSAIATAPGAPSGHGPAQGVRRRGRPRRHRPRDRRGHGLRAARPERRRQDHDRADPLDAACPPTPGEIEVAGFDVAREPDRVRGGDRRHRPVLGRRQPADRRGEPAA